MRQHDCVFTVGVVGAVGRFPVVMCKEERNESDSVSSLSVQGWQLKERKIPPSVVYVNQS